MLCVAATVGGLEQTLCSDSSRLEVFRGLTQETSLLVFRQKLMQNQMHNAVSESVIVFVVVKVIDLPSSLFLRSWPLVDLGPARPPGLVIVIRVSILFQELLSMLWRWGIYVILAWELLSRYLDLLELPVLPPCCFCNAIALSRIS